MRILIFGATGGTGRELVTQALQRGHDVTAFVRSPDKLSSADPHLRVLRGDVANAEAVRAAVPGHDAVVSALGAFSRVPTTLLSDAAREIVAAMQAHGVRRIVWESAFGVGETRRQMGPIVKWVVPFLLRHPYADKERQEAILKATSLEWTIVQPPALTDGPLTEVYRVGPDVSAGRFYPKISRADVAHFMLGELETPSHVRQVVSVCSSP